MSGTASKMEQAQSMATWKGLSTADADGSMFLSKETAREMSESVPYEHVESERIRSERWQEVTLEGIRNQKASRQSERQEGVQDLVAPAAGQALAQQMLQKMLGVPGPAEAATGPGVAQTPVPTEPPQPQNGWDPAQPLPGV